MGFAEVGEAYLLSQNKTESHEPWPRALDMMLALSKLMSLAEGHSVTHAMEMAMMAGNLAQVMAFSPKECRLVMQAALLHDIGIFQLFGRFTPTQEVAFTQHVAKIQAKDLSELPDIQRHLDFPQTLIALLHLDPEVARWIAYHHLFLDQSGLVPDLPRIERPSMGINLLTFCDSLMSALGKDKNLNHRFEYAMAFVQNDQTQRRFYPEIITAFQTTYDQPACFKLSDTQTTHQYFEQIYPASDAPDFLNSLEVLHLCRWVGHQIDRRQLSYTEHESDLTADLSVKMGRALKLPLESLGQLALAGLLHDVGKVAVPLAVLNSEKSLTGQDQSLMESHVHWVATIFGQVPGFQKISEWMGSHHEALNGTGYPYGRRRHEIPVGARLLALADAYVALTHPRSFRPMPYRVQDALEILKKQQGRIYDPSLLQLLEDVVCFQEKRRYTPTS